MTSKEQLLQRLDESRQVFLAALADVPAETEVHPHWQVKHLLAHLAGWEEATVMSLEALRDGDAYEIPAYRGINEYNAQSVATRQELNYGQVYREWEMARASLKATLAEVPLDRFEQQYVLPWGQQANVEHLIMVMVDHELEHAADLRRAAAGDLDDVSTQ